MAKRSKQRLLRSQSEKDHLGCMAGLISLFDFRHGRSTRRLISDRRRKNAERPPADALQLAGETKMQTTSTQKLENTEKEAYIDVDESKKAAAESIMTSIKTLMEEEMSKVRKPKKKLTDSVLEQIRKDLALQEPSRKNNKKTCKKPDMDVHSKSKEIFPLVEEFCSNSNYCQDMNSDQNNLSVQVVQKHSDLDERLREALEAFLAHKYIEANELCLLGATEQSKALKDAIQIIHSNKDFFLQLLQDPNSVLVKHIRGSQNAQADKVPWTESCKESNGPSLLEEVNKDSTHWGKAASQKPKDGRHKLFGRKDNTMDKNPPSISADSSHKIVILKSNRSSTQSRFSIEEIKMKLKNAIGDSKKERHWLFMDKMPCKHRNSGSGELFYQSKTNTEGSVVSKFGDKRGNSKDCQSQERESIINTEAKKHLMEMLTVEDEDETLLGRRVPKTLGRIISSPDDNILSPRLSPLSPKGSKEPSCLSEYKNICSSKSFQLSPVNYGSRLGKNEEPNENPDVEAREANSKLDSRRGYHVEDAAEENNHIMEDNDQIAAYEEIRDIRDSVSEKESNLLDVQSEYNEPQIIDILGKEESTDSSEEDSVKDTQHMLRLPEFFSASPIQLHRIDAHDKLADRLERPSPISVLEPFPSEDDVSPVNSTVQIGEIYIQPRKICFEEDESSALNESKMVQDISPRIQKGENDFIYEYITEILAASGLNCDELRGTWQSAHTPLDPSLLDQVEAPSSQFPDSHRLIFYCINEVLLEIYERLFGCLPWVSFVKVEIRPIPTGKHVIREVIEGIAWYLIPPGQRTLDQTVEKDMAKDKSWMDLRFDTEEVGFEMGDSIIDKILEEMILELWD